MPCHSDKSLDHNMTLDNKPMMEVPVLPNGNLSTSKKSAENTNHLQEITWVIPRVLSCTSHWVDKGPKGAELRGSETAAGRSEQVWAHLFYIIWLVQSLTQGSFMEHSLQALELSSVGHFSCCKDYITPLSAPLLQTRTQRITWRDTPWKKRVLWGEKQTNKDYSLQSKAIKNISGPDYIATILFYTN